MKPLYILAIVALVAACDSKETVQPKPARSAPPASPVPGLLPLTADGWGPVRMQMTEAELLATLGDNIVPASQVRDEQWEACHMVNPLSPEGVWIMVEKGKVTRVTIEDGPVRTDRGLIVGDPVAKVRGAYPEGLVETPHKYDAAPAMYLTWYARPGAAGIRYSINSEGTVGSISGGTPSIEYVEGCS